MAQAISGRNVTMDWPGFNPRPSLIDYATLGQNFLRVVRLSPASIGLPLLLGPSFICHQHCTTAGVQSAVSAAQDNQKLKRKYYVFFS
jgi:hypothetical protein